MVMKKKKKERTSQQNNHRGKQNSLSLYPEKQTGRTLIYYLFINYIVVSLISGIFDPCLWPHQLPGSAEQLELETSGEAACLFLSSLDSPHFFKAIQGY